jgi:antitoxin (DNA-binding transcriptional repressor) of toxin-antitoxin stability system
MAATKFKAHCLAVLDRMPAEGIVIPMHGKPVAKLVPFGGESSDLIGSLRGKIRIEGDIVSSGRRWNARSRHRRTP